MSKDRIYAWSIVAATGGFILWQWSSEVTPPPFTTFVFWISLLLAVELLPVALGFGTTVTMGLPIYLALALLFPPVVSMGIAGVSAFDPRELRREVALHTAAFNRAQIMLAVGLASLAFTPQRDSLTAPDMQTRDFLVLTGAIVLSAMVYTLTNLGLVTAWVHARQEASLREALRTLIPEPASGFWVSYALLVGMGASTALVYRNAAGVGAWAVAAFMIPLVFARLSLQGARTQQQLSERVRKQQESLLVATEKVFEERENERKRIAEDIHDTSLQMLAAAAYGCGNAEQLLENGDVGLAKEAITSSKEAIDRAVAGLRGSLVDLRSSSVEDGGLLVTVKKFVDQAATLWGVNIDIDGSVEREPPIPVALAAFQILQEGLTNALKHAHTDSVTVRITDGDGMVHIVVEDTGMGFDTAAEVGSDHVGMRLMKERAERVGGRIELESRPGSGTRLEAILPGGVG